MFIIASCFQFTLKAQVYIASQSSQYSSCSGTYATLNDGNFNTGPGTNNGASEWIEAAFAAPQTITAVTLAGGNITSCPWGAVAAYLNGGVIQSSTNNSTWTTEATISGMTDAGATTFSVGCVTAQYWRIQKSGYLSTTEFIFTFGSPMAYSSSTTTQNNTAVVGINTTNNEVIGIQIVTTGCSSPLSATSFSFNTTGTTAPATDITNAKLWFTGTSNSFATTTQFGSTVASPNGAFSIAGTQTLSSGINYFWLTYDVTPAATINNFIDGECTSLTVTIPRTPTATAPAGNRQISPLVPPTYQCQSLNNSSGTSLVITKPGCVTTNDLMIAHITARSTALIVAPAGWTSVANFVNSQFAAGIFYKVATGAEPASYTFTSNISDNTGAILVYRGVEVTDPIETSASQLTSGTSHTTPCITATTDQTMIVTFFSLDQCSNCNLTDVVWTPPAGMTERYDIGMVASSWKGESGDDVVQTAKGCVSAKTATSSINTSGMAAVLVLRPSGGTDYYSTINLGGSTNFDASSSVTLTKPTVKQNDLILVHLSAAVTVTGAGATPPAGWTLLRFDLEASGIGSWIYYKVAGASEPSSYSFSVSSGINLIGDIRAYRGIDPASPVQTSAGASVPSGTSFSSPSITTTSDSSLVLTFYTAYAQVSFTPPANANERYDYANAQNHWKTISGDDFLMTPAGATGTKTATASTSAVGLVQIASFNRLSGKISGSCCGFLTAGPLPVEWIYFSSTATDNATVKLNWATASEQNNNYFQIERSSDANNFIPVGIVYGAGNSSIIKNYEFIDNSELRTQNSALLYYRLKQVDFNGDYKYSQIKSVLLDNSDVFEVNVYPNPASERIVVEYSGFAVQCLEIMNTLGEIILKPAIQPLSSAIILDLSNQPDGIYLIAVLPISIRTENKTIYKKIAIQKK